MYAHSSDVGREKPSDAILEASPSMASDSCADSPYSPTGTALTATSIGRMVTSLTGSKSLHMAAFTSFSDGLSPKPSHPRTTVSPGMRTNSLPSLSKRPVAVLRPHLENVFTPTSLIPLSEAMSDMSDILSSIARPSKRGIISLSSGIATSGATDS